MSEARAILRCVDWMLKRSEPVDARMWEAIYEIANNPEADFRARLRAWEMLADRVDPVPRAVDGSDNPAAITAVQINILPAAGSHPPSRLPSGGVDLHLDSGNGDER
jgi:hypothetical protein